MTVQQVDWSTLDAWTWLKLALVVLPGWAVLLALGPRLTRRMPWYGATIIWSYLVCAAAVGTWFVLGHVQVSLRFGRPVPHVGQLIVMFLAGAALWPYFFGLSLDPRDVGDRR